MSVEQAGKDLVKVYGMCLHEVETFPIGNNQICSVMRVPGGWIYTTYDYNPHNDRNVISSVFVPYIKISEAVL